MTEDELFKAHGFVLNPRIEDVPVPDVWRCTKCRAPYGRTSPNLTILLGGYARVLCCNQSQLVEPERKRR